jgi:hypothetical protein
MEELYPSSRVTRGTLLNPTASKDCEQNHSLASPTEEVAMSDACRFTLIVCLASTASFAQIPTKDVAMVPLGADCPVGVRAMLTKGGNLLPAQRLQVTLTQWPPFGILGPPPPIVTVRSSPDSRWYAWVTGFAAVNSVDLESVSFADGTSWLAIDGRPCRVSVSPSVW